MLPLHDDNPTRTTPYVTISLIVLCVLAFLWQIGHNPRDQQAILVGLGFIPALVLGGLELPEELYVVPPVFTLVTSMFLHGGWMHLLGNMLYLWIFGNNVEDAMGHLRFIGFYLICGFAAALSQGVPNPESQIPMVGASGAISGVLGAYLLLHPYARVMVVIPLGFLWYTLYLPAMVVLGLWFGLQIISSLAAQAGAPGVAWFAHIGGFVAGVVLIPVFRQRNVRLWQRPRR